MEEAIINDIPRIYKELVGISDEIGFTMPSDMYIGSLLKTLVASKPEGNFLELGTGASLSLSWMVDGMDSSASLITLDNDVQLTDIATSYFGEDKRVQVFCTDGEKWLNEYKGAPFDLIFADTWPGKYFALEKTLDLLKKGGIYVIDDMNPQPNWPEGHAAKAAQLIHYLENRKDLHTTKMNWSTGIIVAVKK